LDHFLDGFPRGEQGLLLQQPDAIAFCERDLSEVVLVHARDDAQQRALPRSIQPEDADLGPVIEGQVDILEHLLLGRVHAAHADEGKDDLLVRRAHTLRRSSVCGTRETFNTPSLIYSSLFRQILPVPGFADEALWYFKVMILRILGMMALVSV